MDGVPLLAELVQRAGERLAIMPGSGVRPENVAHILDRTGAREIHASCRTGSQTVAPEAVALGFANTPRIDVTAEESVAKMVEILRVFEIPPAG